MLARAVGYEFQMLKSDVGAKAPLPYKGKGWKLEADGSNLEFVTVETDDKDQASQRAKDAQEVAAALVGDRPPSEVLKGPPKPPRKALQQLDLVRGATKVTARTAQPQINADVRIDLVDTFFKLVDTVYPPRREDLEIGAEPSAIKSPWAPPEPGAPPPGDPQAEQLFANRSSFTYWRQTKPEYHEASTRFIDPPDAVLRGMVDPENVNDEGLEAAKLRGLLRLMFQYLVHGKRRHMSTDDFMKDLAFLSKSNMGLAAGRIQFADTYGGGVPVHELITDLLTTMTDRQRSEHVFSTLDDTPRIADWVEIIVREHDDPLASLPDKATGRRFASHRVNYPTSLGGLGLAKTVTPPPKRASQLAPAAIPEIVVEFRRIPEIPIEKWSGFADQWFSFFEDFRRKRRVQDV